MGTDLNEMEAMITELLELERLRDGRGIRCQRQDLVPILRDAAKYSLPNSHPVQIFAEQNGEWVVVRISDNGPGIPDSDISNLFEPFFRVDRSRSKKTGGYGLGLSICKRVMEAHGGRIVVRNNAVRGASFILTLPTSGAGQRGTIVEKGGGRPTPP